MRLPERIKTARQAAGLSQQALADLLDKTQSAISQWEQGTTVPEFDAALPLARALGVTLDWLFGADDSDLVNMSDALFKRTGMQVISQLSGALTNSRISSVQLQLLAGLINQFSSLAPLSGDVL